MIDVTEDEIRKSGWGRMKLGDALCNVCVVTAENLGFGLGVEPENLPQEPCYWMLLNNLCHRCGKKVSGILKQGLH